MEDKCPFCGAEKGKYSLKNQWMCSSFWIPSTMTYMQSSECKDRQIANLTASLDRWKELALELKEKLDVVREQRNMVQGNDVYHFVIKVGMILNDEVRAIAALKAAGEWEE